MTTVFHVDPTDARWSRGLNALQMAGRIGYDTNGSHIGQEIFTALEVAFICRAMRHPRFKKVSRRPPRLKHNVMFVWGAGLGKSYSGDMFFDECVGTVPASAVALRGRPRIINNSGGMTFAKMRGGANSRGDPIVPALIYADFVNISDMPALFGEFPRIDHQLMRQFGFLAEEGYMEISFQKLDDMDEEEAEEFAEKSKFIPGFRFTVQPRGFSFDCGAAFTIFTTEMSDEERDTLKRMGFYSRFDVHVIDSTDQEESNLLLKFNPNAPMTVRTEDLRALNDDIWNTKFCEIPWPPEDLMLNYAQATIIREVIAMAADARVKPTKYANYRDIGNIARVMAAHAVASIFVDRVRGDRSPVESITYSKEDADFAIQYFRPHLDQMRVAPERTTDLPWDNIPANAIRALSTTLGERPQHEHDVESFGIFETEEFFKACSKTGTSRKTAQNWISMFRKAGVVKKGSAPRTSFVSDEFLGHMADHEKEAANGKPGSAKYAGPKITIPGIDTEPDIEA